MHTFLVKHFMAAHRAPVSAIGPPMSRDDVKPGAQSACRDVLGFSRCIFARAWWPWAWGIGYGLDAAPPVRRMMENERESCCAASGMLTVLP